MKRIPPPQPGIKSQPQRALFLDIFRIFLCSGIVFYHYTPVRPACGAYMVNAFFVMSGFLLALAFDRMPQLDLNRFYSSKALRLLPIYFSGILIGVALRCFRAWYAGKSCLDAMLPDYTAEQWGNLCLPKWVACYDSPLWFVTVELILLLAAPLFFVIFKKRIWFAAFFLLMLGTAGFLYSRVPYMADHGAGLYYSPICRSWQLLGGMVSAAIYLSLKGKQCPQWCRYVVRGATLLVMGLFLCGAYVTMTFKQCADLHCWNFTYEFDVLTVGVFMAVIPLLYRLPNIGGKVVQKWVTWAALLTYPVYVTHVLAQSVTHSLRLNAIYALLLTLVMSWCLLVAQQYLERLVKKRRCADSSAVN